MVRAVRVNDDLDSLGMPNSACLLREGRALGSGFGDGNGERERERERERRRVLVTFALRIIFPSDFCVLIATSLPFDKEFTACLMLILLSAFPLLLLSAIDSSGKMLLLLFLSETTFLACLCCYGCETQSFGQQGR